MMMKTMATTMKLTMMRLYDNDDDDDDPYEKVLVEVNKPNFTTRSKIKMCSIIVISYACLKL